MFSQSLLFLTLLSALGAYILNDHLNLSGWSIPQWVPFANPSPASYVCETPRMKPHFLSYDPIMVYIENFLTPYEAQHLKALALPHYHTSVIQNSATQQTDHHIEPTTRNSQTAWLLSPDPVVDCVRARAAAFQGFAPNRSMDALAAVKYDAGQQYRPHYDWDAFNARAADRRTSFFAILEADCEGGATRFPEVRRTAWRSKKAWCGKGWVECGEEGGKEGEKEKEGLAVRPVVGNALFWVNFREDGSGHEGTLHAGMPVVEGTKIGLNIWTYGKVKAPE